MSVVLTERFISSLLLPVWAINYTVTLSSTSKRGLTQKVNGESEQSVTRRIKTMPVPSESQAGFCPAGSPENRTIVEGEPRTHCPAWAQTVWGEEVQSGGFCSLSSLGGPRTMLGTQEALKQILSFAYLYFPASKTYMKEK